ncbi:MAG: anhydro-N-acetylmuramic acid kinase [Butyrivibrio sp.]|jgi:anhydro-N-acetylmuramic acid kinase|nr:anhydro-N-acetylmuramic acid kinase [Butyrivibrio sp.]
MMRLQTLMQKKERLVIGLMSGTSADGIDAALVKIAGSGVDTQVQIVDYITIPYEDAVRKEVLKIAGGKSVTAGEICEMNVLLGKCYLHACLLLCQKAGVKPENIDLVGSHGQTIWHQPQPADFLRYSVTSTLQIGDVSPICEAMNTVCVSDFRMRDMAAGGQGAPLVPYTEYFLYRDAKRNIALQNIGGIGNITMIPAGCSADEMLAFDTGPGNMLIDAMIFRMTGGRQQYDRNGETAAAHQVDDGLLNWLMQEPYITMKPPKSTGRERYDDRFMDRILQKAKEERISDGNVVASLTAYTAETIAYAVHYDLPCVIDRLIIGGGGSYNKELMRQIRRRLPEMEVVTNEDLGYNGDAKEAVAFAILANETINGMCGNIPSVTGAAHPVILGRISQ